MNPSSDLPQAIKDQLTQLSKLEKMRLFGQLEYLKDSGQNFTELDESFIMNSYGDLGTIMFQKGIDYAMANIYSASQVAEKLGITDGLVRRLAHKLGLGKKLSPQVWVFLPADVEQIENRNKVAGRPERKI